MKLINYAVPKEKLREETVSLAQKLMKKNPQVLRAAKEVYKYCRTMEYAQAEDYMGAKGTALRLTDPEKPRDGDGTVSRQKDLPPGLASTIGTRSRKVTAVRSRKSEVGRQKAEIRVGHSF